jgi:hypothetical protein
MPGEQACLKLPEQFRPLFSSNPRLSADIGEALATWAAGTEAPKPRTADELCADYASCSDPASLGRLESQRALAWAKLSKDDKARVKQASDDAKERIERAARTFDDTPVGAVDDSADDDSDADADAA